MMTEVYVRKFKKDVYDKVDAPCKKVLIKYLEEQGHKIVQAEENYNADVVTEKDGETYYHEVERKSQWSGGWPPWWKEIRIPGRKRRLLEKYDSNKLFFYIVDKDYEQAWKIKATQMSDDNLQKPTGPNYRIPKNETFYHIPYQEAELIKVA